MSQAILKEPEGEEESRESEATAETAVEEARRAVDARRRAGRDVGFDEARVVEPAVVEDAAGRELGLDIDGDPDPGEVAAIAAAVAECVATDGGRDAADGAGEESASSVDSWTLAGRYATTTGRQVRCPGGDCSDAWRWAARADGGW